MEGIPPVPTRLVERIRAWQYVDLADLLVDSASKADETMMAARAGQVLLVQSMDQIKKKKRQHCDMDAGFFCVRSCLGHSRVS